MRRRGFPNVAHVGLLGGWVAAVLAARVPIRDNSFLWHVTAGRLQTDLGSVLQTDPFSFTFSGEPWLTQSWLVELGYGWLDRRFGLGFVPWLVGGVGLAVFGLVGLISYKAAGLLPAVGAIVLSAWLGVAYLSPRPVLFSYLFFAVLIAIDSDDRLRWSAPLVLWVWAGVHGSFAIGLAYLVLSALRRRVVKDVRIVVASLIAVTVTAHGLGAWRILLDFVASREALDFITEWAPPRFATPRMVPFVAGLVLMLAAAARGRLKVRDLWVGGPFIALGLTSQRSVFPAWLALVPLVALGLTTRRSVGQPSGIQTVINWVLVAAILVLPFIARGGPLLDEKRFPVAAAATLTSDRVFHDDVVGGYLIYSQWPERQVFVDDRAELFGAEFYRRFVNARSGRVGWEELFGDYAIAEALLRVEDPLVASLTNAGWSSIHQDDSFVVLTAPHAEPTS